MQPAISALAQTFMPDDFQGIIYMIAVSYLSPLPLIVLASAPLAINLPRYAIIKVPFRGSNVGPFQFEVMYICYITLSLKYQVLY